jgi:copper(I)-binding protein
VIVEDAWMRATPPGAPVAGGYLTLRNSGDTSDRLLSIRSPAAREVQIHEVRHDAGIARMRPLPDALAIAADSTVTMRPGSMHLMFVDPVRSIAEGASVPATLQFERAGTIEVTLEVRGAGAMATDEHAGH